MKVRFWGTRGSIPTPGPHTAEFGGNTSCVQVRTDDGTLIVLDCGTGIRNLGLELEKHPGPHRIHLFIGHTHWDHIQGFPFFSPAFWPGTELTIYAPLGFQHNLEEALAGQMQYAYFPVKLQEVSGRIGFKELDEGFLRIGEVLVETYHLNHTAPTVAYRISADGACLAYVTDHEPFSNDPDNHLKHPGDQRHVAFLKDVDLVIHDAQYTQEEYREKIGWGHSTIDYAVDVALAAHAQQLALFHHDPAHDDATMRRIEKHARERARGTLLDVFAAREGLEIRVDGRGRFSNRATLSALDRRTIAGSHVVVMTESDQQFMEVEQALADDGLLISRARDVADAVRQSDLVDPDLVVVDALLMRSSKGFIEALRNRTPEARTPLLVLGNSTEVTNEDAFTDYLALPFSAPMLRSRARAWLSRRRVNAQPSNGDRRRTETTAELMSSVPLFRTLGPYDIAQLLAHASIKHFTPGQTVIRQGEPAKTVYVLISGRLLVTESMNDSTVELRLGELVSGEIFGELGILRDQPRSATVQAVERCTCLVFPQTDFLKVLETSSQLSLGLLKVLAKRVYEADRALARYAPDPLTGLPGRRAFQDLYTRMAAAAMRRNSGLLLVVIDLRQLKKINDRHGYKTGDDVLRCVADALVECGRPTDLVVRCGSDEFAILFGEAEDLAPEVAINRIERAVRSAAEQRRIPVAIEYTVGFTYAASPPATVDELLRSADHNAIACGNASVNDRSAGESPVENAR